MVYKSCSKRPSVMVSVLAKCFAWSDHVFCVKCLIRTIRKDFVKMSINVFDVGCFLTYLDHHSLLKSVSDQDFKSFNWTKAVQVIVFCAMPAGWGYNKIIWVLRTWHGPQPRQFAEVGTLCPPVTRYAALPLSISLLCTELTLVCSAQSIQTNKAQLVCGRLRQTEIDRD